MSTALVNPNDQNQQWLAPIPDEYQGPLAAQIAKLPVDDQKLLKEATKFVNPEHLAACESADDVLELLKITAEAMLTDQQTNYLPAVWTIDHRSQRWVDDQGNPLGDEIEGVLVYYMQTRGLFIEGRKQPLCSAIGTWERGKAAPDAQEAWAKYKLYDPSKPITWSGQERDCANCPFNQFGSDPKTGTGKACKEKYREFFAPVGPDGQFTGEGVMLNIPSTSLRNKDDYVSKLRRYKPSGSTKVEPKTTLHFVTGLSLEKAEGQGQTYSKIVLKAKRLLTYREFMEMYTLRKQIASVAETIDISYGETYDQQPEPGADGPPPEYADAMPQDGDDF